jgi:SIR2-like domain/Sir2- and TIR-associating SLOG family
VPITQDELVRQFGPMVLAGTASLFVGAGLSQDAGYPGWGDLLDPIRSEASIPGEINDLPLVAEYYIQQVPGGRDRLNAKILADLSTVTAYPADGHSLLARLKVAETWTTNYDRLIEKADPDLKVITRDSELADLGFAGRRLVKMHGSLGPGTTGWDVPPIIARSDYESYDRKHIRLWTALQAQYLRSSFLFLGFSFSDPNIEILLRLSRRLGAEAPRHYTVIRRPSDGTSLRLHELQVADLEATGVSVVQIDEYGDLGPLLANLVRRTRKPRLFVSGSVKHLDPVDAEGAKVFANELGTQLASSSTLQLTSLAGDIGLELSFGLANERTALDAYQPEDIDFHFRQRTSPATPLPQRTGRAIHTGLDRPELLKHLLPESRALLAIAGGTKTAEELDIALSFGLPVIPLPTYPGAARDFYENYTHLTVGLPGPEADDARDWQQLASNSLAQAKAAAVRLVRRAAYLDA